MTTDRTSLGDRIKQCYENPARHILPGRMPVVCRVDGKAFHRWTVGLARPFDDAFIDAMDAAAMAICAEAQGAVMAYVQSDEISVVLHGYKTYASTPWFDNNKSKIETVAASIAAGVLTEVSPRLFGGKSRRAAFDGRAFVVPESDVANCLIWRQQDAARNSVSMVAQTMFSHRELHGKSCAQRQEMIFARSGQNWNDLPTHLRRGRCVIRETTVVDGEPWSKWVVDRNPPLFTADRGYIERLLAVDPEPAVPIPRFTEEPDVTDRLAARLDDLRCRRDALDAECADLMVEFDGVTP